ncbi:MarR family winged helix-turn-helix transcriptional regulator [Kineococcus glutinatus]|uniref:MarR family transcriptional regulator n=1 Tax=Kineococcus glutinatus TaxID=1070872 RepID=A0ABP9HX22_9ACTN
MEAAPVDAPPRVRGLASWLLNRAAAPANRLVARALEGSGIRRSHYSLLAVLDEHGPTSQAGLSRRTGLDRSDVVAAVNHLAAAGLLQRAPDADDRRRNVVTLTARGRDRLLELDEVLRAVQDEVLAPLSGTERRQLTDLLARIVDHHGAG